MDADDAEATSTPSWDELQARRVPEAGAEAAVVATVLGAVASPGASGTDAA